MKPSEKSPQLEQDMTDLFGFDRRAVIESNKCCPPPIGCGGDATQFRDAVSAKEYTISGLCQKCQDSIFGADEPDEPEEDNGREMPVCEPSPRPPRYVAGLDEFVTDDYRMFSGQGEAVSHHYHKYVGKSGNTWLVADTEAAAENVYVTDTPANTGGDGFGGAHLPMTCVDGTVFVLKGGWHTNTDALYNDTGIDVREKHRTFVVLAKELFSLNDGTGRRGFRGIVYKDNGPTLGRYDRYKDIIKQHPEAKFYYMSSHGGSSSGPISDQDRL